MARCRGRWVGWVAVFALAVCRGDIGEGVKAARGRQQSDLLWEQWARGSVEGAAFSPDGKTIACASRYNVLLWDAASGLQVGGLDGHNGRVSTVAYSPGGDLIVSGGEDSTVRVWDAHTRQPLHTLNHPYKVYSVAFSPDGTLIASGGEGGVLKLWNSQTGAEVRALTGHRGEVRGVAFSPDGALLASVDRLADPTLRIWETTTGALRRTLRGPSGGMYGVAFSPDGHTVAATGFDGSVRLWNALTGDALGAFTGHQSYLLAVAFSPDGTLLASGSNDRTARIWEVATGAQLQVLSGHSERVAAVAFSPDGTQLVTGSWDSTARLWNVSSGQVQRTLDDGHVELLWKIAFSPDGARLASAGHEGSLRMWGAGDGANLGVLNQTTDQPLFSFDFRPDGALVAVGSNDGQVLLWDALSGAEIGRFAHASAVRALAFSPDGHTVASADMGTLRLWDSRTLQESWQSPLSPPHSMAFSPDGTRLAVTQDTAVKILDTATGALLDTVQFLYYEDIPASVSYSPDGTRLAIAVHRRVQLRDASSLELQREIAHSSTVRSVAFSSNGQALATGTLLPDATIRIWNAATGALLQTIGGLESPVHFLTFSPVGDLLAALLGDPSHFSWSAGDGVKVWQVSTAPPNLPPQVPALASPAADEALTSHPSFTFTATDPEGGYLRYRLELSRDGFASLWRAYDQTQSTEGWLKPLYASGEPVVFSPPLTDELPAGTYAWRAAAHDGQHWGAFSEARSFSYQPEIEWSRLEPSGDQCELPLFLLQVDVPGGSGETLLYQLQVSKDPTFAAGVLTFDQQADPLGWSEDAATAPGEVVFCVPPYAFERFTPYYWRARVQLTGAGQWSPFSPANTFRLLPSGVISYFRISRVTSASGGASVWDRHSLQLINPYPQPMDFALLFTATTNDPAYQGRYRIRMPDGTVLAEAAYGEPLETLTLPLAQGSHYLTLETMTFGASGRGGTRAAPILLLGGKIIGSWALTWAIGKGIKYLCEKMWAGAGCDQGPNPLFGWSDGLDLGAEAAKQTALEAGRNAGERLGQSLIAKYGLTALKALGPAANVINWALACYDGSTARQGAGPGNPNCPESGQGVELPITRAWDPNLKVGLAGSQGFIRPEETLSYTVHFENDPEEASAAAQQVVVTDTLDEDIDLSAFRFTGVGVAEAYQGLPAGAARLDLQIPLHIPGDPQDPANPEREVLVEVKGSVDTRTRELRVTFRGLKVDGSGELDPFGFLNPNLTPPEGEGWFSYQALPKEDAADGAEIRNRARIVFDANEPIDTNELVLVIDRSPPASALQALEAVQARGAFDLNWQAQDSASGVETVELWVNEERAGSRSRQVMLGDHLYRLERTLTGAATPPVAFRGKFGYRYRFHTVARDRVGYREAEPEEPDAETVVGVPPLLPAGLQMVSVPVQSEEEDPQAVFGFAGNRWARYDPTGNQGQGGYVLYDQDPEGFTRFGDAEQVPGRGYWVRLEQAATPQVYGPLVDEYQPVVIPLQPGWNQIGNPFTRELAWDLQAIQVRRQGQELTLAEAAQAGWVDDYAWGWDVGSRSYQLIYDAGQLSGVAHELQPWQGYWVKAEQACELVLPAPATQSSILSPQSSVLGPHAGESAGGHRGAAGGWGVRLQAEAAGERAEVVVGAGRSRGLQVGGPPAPPEGASGLQMVSLRQGVPLAVDVRRGLGRQVWDLAVVSPSHPLTHLTWPDLRGLPGDVSLTLEDTVTGARRYLRATRAYTWQPQPGETQRRFRLIAEPGRERVLQITNLRATATRGGAMEVRFALSRAASTTVRVLRLTGQTVSDLEQRHPRQATEQVLRWDGRDGQGRKLPAGVYLLEVMAEDEEGRQVKAVTTVAVR